MKRTLLEMVQDILSALDSDEVNSISDTIEAMQVATILKNCYLDMCSNRDWSGQKRLISFDHSADRERPTHLKSPERIKELHSFRYNGTKKKTGGELAYNDVRYLDPDVFLRRCGGFNPNNPHSVVVKDWGGTDLVIINNKAPTYWTTFDDEWIVCDSWDAEVDDTLKASKTQLHVTLLPSFELDDEFIPLLPAESFQQLFNEAKSIAFVELKQMVNQKAEQEAVRQRTWNSRKEWQLHGGIKTNNYGRGSRK